ncbi:MAG: septal ring lytic transglycosylase RlpA family protein [Candidatus Neomarinimicrobiota bacterium]
MKTHNCYNIKFILLLCPIIIINCSSSPRYTTGSYNKPTSSKSNTPSKLITKANNKHRKVIKGISSFYAEDFHGKLTANGEVYDMYGLTAAHKTLPLNTIVRVTNISNNKSLILRINDRGPYVKGRILDCSYGAAKKLGFVNDGTAKVKIEVIEWGDNKYMKHRK